MRLAADARHPSETATCRSRCLGAKRACSLANMSADPENEYFTEGMSEELITPSEDHSSRCVAHIVVCLQVRRDIGEMD